MRKIKFRAWSEENKKMILWKDIQVFRNLNKLISLHHVRIMQYTGLKDRNDKEIYEGDILKHHGIVAWNDVEYRWSAIDLNWNDKREWHDIDYLTDPFEVIGNIYENKDLLT